MDNINVNLRPFIYTDERIFKVKLTDGRMMLSNTNEIKKLLNMNLISKLWHLWDWEFKRVSVKDVKEMVKMLYYEKEN